MVCPGSEGSSKTLALYGPEPPAFVFLNRRLHSTHHGLHYLSGLRGIATVEVNVVWRVLRQRQAGHGRCGDCRLHRDGYGNERLEQNVKRTSCWNKGRCL